MCDETDVMVGAMFCGELDGYGYLLKIMMSHSLKGS